MKKSRKKVIKYLKKRYVNHEVLRTKPARGDWSHTDGKPIILIGFTPDGKIKYKYTGSDVLTFGDKEFILPIYFTDRNWITYNSALKAKGSALNKWKGKRIRRIRPTGRFYDHSYMHGEAPTLIAASKHHIVLKLNDPGLKGLTRVLPAIYANPADWELAE